MCFTDYTESISEYYLIYISVLSVGSKYCIVHRLPNLVYTILPSSGVLVLVHYEGLAI